MPGISGIELLKIINEKYPAVRILILTAFLDEMYVLQCLQNNIYGFLGKNMDLNEIKNAIQSAYQNKLYTTNLLANLYLKSYLQRNNKNIEEYLPEFSVEEIQILEMLKMEKTTEEIANTIFLSKRSIEFKRERMKEKAKVKTIGGLLLYALKRNFIE